MKLVETLRCDCRSCGLPVYISVEMKEVFHELPVCPWFEDMMKELEAEAMESVECFPLENAGNG